MEFYDDEFKWLQSRPQCEECGEHIGDEFAYQLPTIGWVCEHCMDEFRQLVPEEE